jgi:hypothetical protein
MTNLNRLFDARVSRRTLFKGAGAAGLGLSLGSGLLGKGPLLRQAGLMRAAAADDESLSDIINIAITAEALAVTLLGGVVASAQAGMYDMPFPELVVDVFNAARAEEQFHYDYLEAAGAVPLTTTFNIPDPALLTSSATLLSTVVTLETAFVAAYTAAARRFSELGHTELVKISVQTVAVEAEHRVLASYVLGTRPANNFAFYPALFSTVGEAAQALIDLGFIGGSGTAVDYPGPGEIDASNVMNTQAGAGPSVACIVPQSLAGGVVLVAPMSGNQDVPPADPDGFGFAKVVVNPALSQICFRLSVANIAPATAAHIHSGAYGTNGPVVVPFVPPGPDGLIDGCVVVDAALAQAIVDNPSGYYVNVHNADYPAGAVRGQLSAL